MCKLQEYYHEAEESTKKAPRIGKVPMEQLGNLEHKATSKILRKL
jgi:hypothetical protein